MWARTIVLAAVVSLLGCVSFGVGTKDTSSTSKRSGTVKIESIAVLPVPEHAGANGLSEGVERALAAALRAEFPGALVLEPEAFGQALAQHKGYLAHFGRWRSIYEQTKMLDPKPLPHYAKASGAQYLLLVRALHLDREEMAFRDVEKSGCCFAVAGKKFWQTEFALAAELIDARSARVVWRGRGEARHVNEGGGSTTYSGLMGLQVHHSNPDIVVALPELIRAATTGAVREIAGRPVQISRR